MSEISNFEDETVRLVGQPFDAPLDLSDIPKEYHKQFIRDHEQYRRYVNGETNEMIDDSFEQVKLDMEAAGMRMNIRTRAALAVRKLGSSLVKFSYTK